MAPESREVPSWSSDTAWLRVSSMELKEESRSRWPGSVLTAGGLVDVGIIASGRD